MRRIGCRKAELLSSSRGKTSPALQRAARPRKQLNRIAEVFILREQREGISVAGIGGSTRKMRDEDGDDEGDDGWKIVGAKVYSKDTG